MKKTIKLILFTIISIILSPVLVNAESTGSIFANNNYIYQNGTKTSYEVENISFDSDTKKLTLNNYDGGQVFIEDFSDEITIELKGENNILVPAGSNSFGLGLLSEAKIIGTGSLLIKHSAATNSWDNVSGIFASGKVNFLGGKITVDGEQKHFDNAIYLTGEESSLNGTELNLLNYYGNGINSTGKLTINNGTINASSLEKRINSGISFNKLYINGGTLNFKFTTTYICKALYGDELYINGGNIDISSLQGIKTIKTTITNGNLMIVAPIDEEDMMSAISSDFIYIKGGNVDIKASIGIQAWKLIEIIDGTIKLESINGLYVWAPSVSEEEETGGIYILGGTTTMNLKDINKSVFALIFYEDQNNKEKFPLVLGDEMYTTDSSLRIITNDFQSFIGNKDSYYDEEEHEYVNNTTKSTTITKYNYNIIEQSSTNLNSNNVKDLIIKVNGDYNKVAGIYIDNSNELLDAKYYTLAEGSTIVTLKADYIKSLKVGNHTLSIVYSNGKKVDATFSISMTNPETGDSVFIYFITLILVIGTLQYILKQFKKQAA